MGSSTEKLWHTLGVGLFDGPVAKPEKRQQILVSRNPGTSLHCAADSAILRDRG